MTQDVEQLIVLHEATADTELKKRTAQSLYGLLQATDPARADRYLDAAGYDQRTVQALRSRTRVE